MDEDEDDNTRVVARPEPSAPGDNDDDATRVVHHEIEDPEVDDEDDATRVVTHAAAEAGDSDSTRIAAHRSSDDDNDENTRVLARDAKQHSLTLPASGRRRGISLPPAMGTFAPQVEVARGPGAVETYPAREIPAPPPPPIATEQGPEATRVPAPSMPSVARRSRVAARVALSVFVSSCVLAVAGIIVAVVLLL